jgi:hypothetical protein
MCQDLTTLESECCYLHTVGGYALSPALLEPVTYHQQPITRTLGVLPSQKKRGNDYHVKRSSPVNIDGRRKAKMSQNDQPIAQRDENCNGEEYCGGAPVSPPEERLDCETRKDVSNSLDPQKWKGSGVVDRNAVGSGGPNRVE